MKDHARRPVADAVQDASPQVTAMIAKTAKDKIRYRVLHAAARLIRGARRRQLRIPAAWPWVTDITTAWQRITAMPQAP